MSLTAALFEAFGRQIEALTLIPSDGGRYELTVDDQLLFSKKQTGQHVEPAVLLDLVRQAQAD